MPAPMLPPDPAPRRSTDAAARRLVLVSAAALLLELALIRYVNSTVQVMAYFTNFLLLSAFLGLGLGSLLPKRRAMLDAFPWIACVVVGAMGLLDRYGFDHAQDHQVLWSYQTHGPMLPVPLVVAIVFVLNGLFFVPLGNQLGDLLEQFESRLTAYGYDLAGSLSGVLGFTLLSALQTPPWVWFGVGGLLVLGVFQGSARRIIVAAGGLALASALTLLMPPGLWSPYYKVQLVRLDMPAPLPPLGYAIHVDKVRIQDALALGDPRLAPTIGLWVDYYRLPYALSRPRSVLILGAGSGNDATIALAAGVERVDVVEIDPVILSLGRHVHPHRPYSDPRVRMINDDARAFLRRDTGTYDLIVMNALDSHLQVPGLSTLRLESYMYTADAFRDARRRMHEGSVLVVHLSSTREWMGQRLYWSLAEAFGREPRLFWTPNSPMYSVAFAYGPPALLDHPAPPAGELPSETRQRVSGRREEVEVATDDWPHLYLAERRMPPLYVGVLAGVLLGTAVLVRAVGGAVGRAESAHFLLLGAGFMLLETRSITKIALLFGTTWIVNAIVIGFILLCVAIGNVLVLEGRSPSSRVAWGGLFATLVLGWLVPVDVVLQVSWAWRVALAGAWVALPILFASFVFSTSFRRASRPSGAFGANLLGVVIGGALEYTSMVLGLQALYLLALATYVGALVAERAWPRPGPLDA
jgi:hypothetical protein